MKPVLYDQNEKEFLSNGIGTLSDCISCIVTEERNGIYELEMEYPITGLHYGDITLSSIIKAVPAPDSKPQPFRIYYISPPINGRVTIKAQHISYQLSFIPASPFTAGTATEAMGGLKTSAVEECPFTFHTDVDTAALYEVTKPQSIRSCLGGREGSMLDTYGGELEWDEYDVYLRTARGLNRGATLKYGKNIIDIKQEKNIQNTITGIYPYWSSEEEIVTLPEKTVSCTNAGAFPFRRTVVHDFSADFTEKPTEDQLRAAAEDYVKSNGMGVPEVNITVSFAMLGQSEQYKHLKLLEAVYLCDTVKVEFEKLNISTEAKVVKTVYNVLKKRYDSVEIGDAKSSLATSIIEQEKDLESKVTAESSERKKALQKLADTLASSSGLFMTTIEQPDESKIYYMHDKKELSESQIIWKLTIEAFGVSLDGGKTWPYGFDISGTAILERIYAIGINASYIKSGEILVEDEDENVLFMVSMATGEVLINKGILKVGAGYISTDGRFRLGPMKSRGGRLENGAYVDQDVYFERAIFVDYGMEIFGNNDSAAHTPYIDLHLNESADDPQSDYTARIEQSSANTVSMYGLRKDEGDAPQSCTLNVAVVNTASDLRLKNTVQYLDADTSLDFINKLKPAAYRYSADKDEMYHYGLIYQDVEPIIKSKNCALLGKFKRWEEQDGKSKQVEYGALGYIELISDLIGAVKALTDRVKKLEKEK